MLKRGLWLCVAWCYFAASSTPAWGALIFSPTPPDEHAPTSSRCHCDRAAMMTHGCCQETATGPLTCPIRQQNRPSTHPPLLTSCADTSAATFGLMTLFRLDPHLPAIAPAHPHTATLASTASIVTTSTRTALTEPPDKIPL